MLGSKISDDVVHLSAADRSSDWIAGGGEMGALVRSLDWSKTALGPLHGWPQSLRTIVSTCLISHFPILLWWGPELVMIYNDALSRIIGNKHPRGMGQSGAEGWWEVWHILGPMLMSVLSEGASTWSENQRLDIERTLNSGYLEETYLPSPTARSATNREESAACSAP